MQKGPRPIFASIPDPTNDVEGLHRSVIALKQAVEQIIGTRGGPVGNERKASVFVQDTEPVPAQDGDFWLCKGGQASSMSISINGGWQVIWP